MEMVSLLLKKEEYDVIRKRIKNGHEIKKIAEDHNKTTAAIHKIGIRANLIARRQRITCKDVIAATADLQISQMTIKECSEVTHISVYYLNKCLGRGRFLKARYAFTEAELSALRECDGKSVEHAVVRLEKTSGIKREKNVIKNKASMLGVELK